MNEREGYASHSQQEKSSSDNHLLERDCLSFSLTASKMIQALLVTISLAVFPYQGSSIILESGKVNDYEVVYPQKVSTLPKGGVQQQEQKAKYEDTLQYEFKVNGKPMVLQLEKNKGLFTKDYTETHYSPDGREITTSPPVEDHCYYHGYIQSDTDSIAAISACNGLKGNFKHQGEMYLIEPLKVSDTGAHAVFKYKSLEKGDETRKICGVTSTSWESDELLKKTSKMSISPEEEEDYMAALKYVEVYLVADHSMFRKFGRQLHKIKRKMFAAVNTLNVIYKVLGVRVALTGMEIWSDKDKILVNETADPTLRSFANWRESTLLKRKWNDNAQLITAIKLAGVIGLGYVGGICESMNSAALIEDYMEDEAYIAGLMAHEMGHNLGINHDPESCTCPNRVCVMHWTLGDLPSYELSPCSIQEHQTFLRNNRPQCLLNKPFRTDIIAPPICGNGLVEKGEYCDCGLPEECENEYCDAKECKLKPGAECEYEECCEKGKIKKAGAECREARDDCDVPEFCTGQSAECPIDRFQANGHPCQNNFGYCYNGKCPTLTNQCAQWESGMKVSPDECFSYNLGGNDYGYCRKENGIKIPCEPKDVKCGKLYCTEGSGESSCTYDGNEDEGMVDPGTKCGEGMVCNNRECVTVETAYGSTNSFSQI